MLTTQSLEEAENFCTWIYIISYEEFICIGTAEKLEIRPGDGHRLIVP